MSDLDQYAPPDTKPRTSQANIITAGQSLSYEHVDPYPRRRCASFATRHASSSLRKGTW